MLLLPSCRFRRSSSSTATIGAGCKDGVSESQIATARPRRNPWPSGHWRRGGCDCGETDADLERSCTLGSAKSTRAIARRETTGTAAGTYALESFGCQRKLTKQAVPGRATEPQATAENGGQGVTCGICCTIVHLLELTWGALCDTEINLLRLADRDGDQRCASVGARFCAARCALASDAE